MPRIAGFFDEYIRSGRAADDIAGLEKKTRK
jgi:hypothetical protein